LQQRRVLDDWVAVLPREKGQLYQVVVRRWECAYAMMSVALDEALSLRASGELVCARQQVSIASGLLGRLAPSLISLCDTLSVRGQHVAKFPAVEPSFFAATRARVRLPGMGFFTTCFSALDRASSISCEYCPKR
jgi:hypothetical protein